MRYPGGNQDMLKCQQYPRGGWTLYPSLVPELRKAGKFLLLPLSPDPAVVDALKEIGITVETFDHTDRSSLRSFWISVPAERETSIPARRRDLR